MHSLLKGCAQHEPGAPSVQASYEARRCAFVAEGAEVARSAALPIPAALGAIDTSIDGRCIASYWSRTATAIAAVSSEGPSQRHQRRRQDRGSDGASSRV